MTNMNSTTLPTMQPSAAPIWLVSAIAALVFHVSIQSWELIDLLLVQLLGVFAAIGFALFYVDVQVYHSTPLDALRDLAIAASSFFLTLTASILTYRAFFHRLRRFPGPFLARLSSFWEVYQSAKNLQFHKKLEELHKQYGDVVRTGPRELSIARLSAVAPLAACRKTIFYAQNDWKQESLGMLETRDLEDHRKRRRPWEMGLSLKEVAKYDEDMQRIIGSFLDQIATDRGQRVNITEWTAWLAYDLMGKIAFGRDFGSLKRACENPTVTRVRGAMKYLGIVFPVPWLINILAHIPGASGEMAPFFEYCKNLVKEKQQAIQAGKSDTPTDVISWLIKAFNEGGPSAAPTQTALDEDTRALVLAGADTTYEALVSAFYYLAANPTVYSALQADLDAAFPGGEPSFTHNQAKNVPLLDAVINETLRLLPPVPGGQPRLTPPGGLRIDDDIYIPGNVGVYVPQWLIQRDERYFERPLDFVPKRWIAGSEQAHTIKDRNAWFPFQLGAFQCAGKQLAMWEMRSVLARMALRYNIRFASADEEGKFEAGMLNTITLSPPPLRMCFRDRVAAKG